MVDRVRIKIKRVPLKEPRKKSKGPGGWRPGSGRRLGSVNEATRVARATAARDGKLPHQLLREWSLTGVMRYPGRGPVLLDSSDRIACARACASYYEHPKAAVQPKDAPAPVVRVEMDERMVAALAKESPDKLEMLRDVLRALQLGGGDLASVVSTVGASPRAADPSRYGRLLSDGEVAGSA